MCHYFYIRQRGNNLSLPQNMKRISWEICRRDNTCWTPDMYLKPWHGLSGHVSYSCSEQARAELCRKICLPPTPLSPHSTLSAYLFEIDFLETWNIFNCFSSFSPFFTLRTSMKRVRCHLSSAFALLIHNKQPWCWTSGLLTTEWGAVPTLLLTDA